MPEYRAYMIGPDGHIIKRIELVCDDEAAKQQAKALVDGHDVECRRPVELRNSSRRTKPQLSGTWASSGCSGDGVVLAFRASQAALNSSLAVLALDEPAAAGRKVDGDALKPVARYALLSEAPANALPGLEHRIIRDDE